MILLTRAALLVLSNFNSTLDVLVLTVLLSGANFLEHGIVRTAKNKANAPYTIVLVGETGVGKTSLLKFIANVLLGNDFDHYHLDILDRLPNKRVLGQTGSSHLYEITSVNGILVGSRFFNARRRHNLFLKVRILDTPGLASADTCSVKEDNIHKESIVTCIKQYVDSVSAVLILARGNFSGTIANTDYTFSDLAALFPKTLVNNIAFMFTRTWGPPLFQHPQYVFPEALKNSPKFFLDNPITPPSSDWFKLKRSREKGCEQGALEMLVNLFDWLDSLESQPATEIVSLYEQYQNIEAKSINILDQRAREVEMRVEIDRLMTTLKRHSAVSLSPCLRVTLESYSCWM